MSKPLKTGDRFGRWTLTTTPIDQRVIAYVECICDCGKTRAVRIGNLRRGESKSCGCYNKDIFRAKTALVPGTRFGRLVIIEEAPRRGNRRNTYWLCQCDCGNKHIVCRPKLTGGLIKSCGCLRQEKTAARAKARRNKNPWGHEHAIYKLSSVKTRARDMPYTLTTEDFKKISLGNCHYCGAPPKQIPRDVTLREQGILRNGPDRKDNAEGYTPTNTVSCCSACNRAKYTYSLQELAESTVRRYQHLRDSGLLKELGIDNL